MSGGVLDLGEAEVRAWGEAIGSSVAPPLLVALDGPLGAGKSVLARGIARGAGVVGPVPSPTYTLVRSYDASPGRRMIHMDLYRLADADEVLDLGWDDLVFDPEALVAIEWAARAGPYLPTDRWAVRLDPVAGAPGLRRVEWRAVGLPHPLPRP